MDLDRINQFNEQQAEAKEKANLLNAISDVGDKVASAVVKAERNTKTVTVTNDLAKPSDIDKVVEAVKAIDLKPQDLQPIADALTEVSQAIAKLPTEYPEFPELPEAPEQREDVKVTNLSELKEYFQEVVTAVAGLKTSFKFNPKIEVKPADVKITERKLDLEPIVTGLANLETAFKNIETPNFDTAEITSGLQAVQDSINGLSFPVPNYVIPFKDINGAAVQVQLDADGNVPTAGSSNGLTDAQLRATPVPISGTVTTTPAVGAATEAKQDSQITLATQLETLTETLQELVQRLAPLAGAMGNTAQLRVIQTSVPSHAVTGPITSAQSIAEKAVAGISYTQRVAIENNTAIQSNINNAVAA